MKLFANHTLFPETSSSTEIKYTTSQAASISRFASAAN
jgi:hypothetical protein